MLYSGGSWVRNSINWFSKTNLLPSVENNTSPLRFLTTVNANGDLVSWKSSSVSSGSKHCSCGALERNSSFTSYHNSCSLGNTAGRMRMLRLVLDANCTRRSSSLPDNHHISPSNLLLSQHAGRKQTQYLSHRRHNHRPPEPAVHSTRPPRS